MKIVQEKQQRSRVAWAMYVFSWTIKEVESLGKLTKKIIEPRFFYVHTQRLSDASESRLQRSRKKNIKILKNEHNS